jgi:hypothetical protein
MNPIKVNLDALTLAFDDNSLERSYYLDRDTGRVFNLLEDHSDPETEQIAWDVEADGGRRYILIPNRMSLEEEIEEREAFTAIVEDGELKKRLSEMLDADGTRGRRFVEFVTRDKQVKDRWRSFRRARSKDRADRWLKSLNLRVS